jgi:hypothetical protein
MDAVDEDRRWYEEIERRLGQRFRGVYLCVAAAAVFGVGLLNTQRLMHEPGLLPATATIVALGTGSGGEPTMTAAFQDAEGNWHRDTQGYGYHYARGAPRVGEAIDYLYGYKAISGDFYAVPRADGFLKWAFGVPAALFALFAVVAGVLVMREHDARRALVRNGLRLPLQAPSIRHRSVTLPGGAAGPRSFELWRLEGRVFDAAAGEFVECASDWQQPPPPQLDPARVPPLLVDPQRPRRRWLPVGALRTAGYVDSGEAQAR